MTADDEAIKQEYRDRISGKIPEPVSEDIKDKNYYAYLLRTAAKTIKQDNKLSDYIFNTCFSAYTDNPINLAILESTSEGKTYPIKEILKYFPKQDVIKIGTASPKSFIRDRGIEVDPDGKPINEQIKNLEKQKDACKTEEEKEKIDKKITLLKDNKRTMIDLRNKILVFLEPPHVETWETLKTVLSHDDEEIDFRFVNHTQVKGHETKHIFVKGWPACIFCSARDDSDLESWPEVKSRFFVVSPNTNKSKYEEAIKLIGQRKGTPRIIQEQLIISQKDIELAKKCVNWIKYNIHELRKKDILENKIFAWLPYGDLLTDCLPKEQGTDMRDADRLMDLIKMKALLNLPKRHILFLEGEPSIIPDLSDLEKVLKLTQTQDSKGPRLDKIVQYKIDFYEKVFLPCFKSKTEPDKKNIEHLKIDICEDRIAVTTSELVKYNEQNKAITKPLNVDKIKKTYLNELIDAGLIGSQPSAINHSQYIYYSLTDVETSKTNIETSKKEGCDDEIQDSQQSNQLYKKITKNLTKQDIFSKINELLEHRSIERKITVQQYVDDEDMFYILGREELPEQELEGLSQELEHTEYIKELEKSKERISFFIDLRKNRNHSTEDLEEHLKEIEAKIHNVRQSSDIEEDIEEIQKHQFEIYDSRRFDGRPILSIEQFLEEYHISGDNFYDVKRSSNQAPFAQKSSNNVETGKFRCYDSRCDDAMSETSLKVVKEGA